MINEHVCVRIEFNSQRIIILLLGTPTWWQEGGKKILRIFYSASYFVLLFHNTTLCYNHKHLLLASERVHFYLWLLWQNANDLNINNIVIRLKFLGNFINFPVRVILLNMCCVYEYRDLGRQNLLKPGFLQASLPWYTLPSSLADLPPLASAMLFYSLWLLSGAKELWY